MDREQEIVSVLLVILSLLLCGCSSQARMPVVKVEGARITSFSLTDLALDVILSIDNPYPVNIPLQSISFDVYYQEGGEWRFLSHGEQTDITIVPGKSMVTVPLTIQNTDLLRSILALAGSGKLPLKISGVVVPSLPGGLTPEIPFSRTISLTGR